MTARTTDRLILVAALALAAPAVAVTFDPVGLDWDSAEYIWMVRADMLPHSPYLGFLLLAKLASSVLAAPSALALLSALAYAGSAVLLTRISRALVDDRPAALVSGFVFLLLPLCMRQAGVQEVYATQGFFVLLSVSLLAGDRRWDALLGGVAFAAALSVHYGSALVLPACVALLCTRRERSGLTGRRRAQAGLALLEFVVPQLLAAAIAVATLCWMFRSMAAPLDEALSYLRGIAPVPEGVTGERAVRALASAIAAILGRSSLGWPLPVIAAAVVGAIYLVRARPRAALVWLLFPSGYLGYEALLGEGLDRRADIVYCAPVLASLAGTGIAALLRSARRFAAATRLPAPASSGSMLCAIAAVGLCAGFYASNLLRVQETVPRAEIQRLRRHPLLEASRWIDRHLPDDAVVVQPGSVLNVNLLPSHHLRRPIIRQGGRYLLLRRYERWTPLNLHSYEDLTPERLTELLREEAWVIAFDRELQERYGVGVRPLPASWGAPIPLFLLQP